MALPLKDFRLGISESIDLWLESVAQANAADKAAIAREVLQEWADRKEHEHKVASRLKRSNGGQTELPWSEAEDAGNVRKSRK